MIVYVAGPYRGATPEDVDANIQRARQIAIDLWEQGHVAICPHLNTAHFEQDCACKDEEYLNGDFEILRRCDAIVMTPDWERSKGATAEREFALDRKMPVYIWNGDPIPLHPTEQKRPKQVRAFIDTVMRMYRVHLDKNADYSPANIQGPGELGLMTRVWDKVSRLMNLMGFKIDIASTSFEKPSAPKCEAVEDSILDLSVYGIIWQLYRRGVWGK